MPRPKGSTWSPEERARRAALKAGEPLDGDPPEEIDPASIGQGEGGAPPASPASRRRVPKSKKSFDVDGVEALFFSIHLTLASFTGMKELAVDKEEARALAVAAGNVARHYDIPELPQTMIDWANLAVTLCVVYGPRAMVLKNRKNADVV